MERAQVLSRFIKRAQYPVDAWLPTDFPKYRYGENHTDLIMVLLKMTNPDHHDRCTLSDAREMLQQLLEGDV